MYILGFEMSLWLLGTKWITSGIVCMFSLDHLATDYQSSRFWLFQTNERLSLSRVTSWPFSVVWCRWYCLQLFSSTTQLPSLCGRGKIAYSTHFWGHLVWSGFIPYAFLQLLLKVLFLPCSMCCSCLPWTMSPRKIQHMVLITLTWVSLAVHSPLGHTKAEF